MNVLKSAILVAALVVPVSRGSRHGAAAPLTRLTLERAVELAVARDERPRIAARQLASFEARVDRARAFFFPELIATGEYTFRGEPGMFQERHVYSGNLTANLTLFDGRGFPLYRAARLGRDAAELDRDESRRLVAFEAAQAYLSTLGLQAVVEAAEHRVVFARETLADARGRVSAQLTSSNDVTRAELELGTAQRELSRAQGELAAGMLNLGWLLGAELRAPLASPDALLTAAVSEPTAREAAVAVAQERRLDVRASRLRVGVARELAKEPLWRWVPSINLTGQADTTSTAGTSGKTETWFVGLTAVWTIWDGERGADRDDLVAQADAADLQVSQQLRRVALEVETALSALHSARDTVTVADAAVVAARKNVEETRVLYRQGLSRALEVADATARLFEAEVAAARERYGLGVALLSLRAAVGIGPLDAGAAPAQPRTRP
jgi:outer membrane protein TolC